MTYHPLPTSPPPREDAGGFILGLLAGAAVGGGLALLFAPRQGADMRQGLASSAQQAGRRLTQVYGSVAGTARRNARRLVSHRGGRDASTMDTDVSSFDPMTSAPISSGQAQDRARPASEVIRDVVGEASYRPSVMESSTSGPGATSPAPPDEPRSPLA